MEGLQCSVCEKKFSRKSNLVQHKVEVHKIVSARFRKYRCALCSVVGDAQIALFEHYEDSHNVKIETEVIELETIELFYSWKSDIERQTTFKFSKGTGDKANANNFVTSYYTCKRNKNYVSQDQSKKSLKTQEASKTKGICPASMKVIKASDGKVTVLFTKTHVGHTAALSNLMPDNATPSLHKETPSKTDSISFICSVCNKKFPKKYNLVRHKMEVHKIITDSFRKYQCALCNHTSDTQTAMFEHYEDSHNVNIETDEIFFETIELFYAWKTHVEKQTKFKFSKRTGDKTDANNFVTSYYTCHRSGNYVPQGKGKRSLKTQGTCKIGGVCPAHIKIKKADDGKVSGYFIKTHVGHTADLSHLVLDSNERDWLATKIAAKIPFKDILDEVRDSISDSKLERLHLLTRKDLNNIRKCYNINNCVQHQSELGDNSPMVLDELQNEVDEESPQLKENDFSSALINEAHCEVIKCDAHLKELSKPHSSISATKFMVKREITELLSEIDRSDTLHELQVIKQLIVPIRPALFAARNEVESSQPNNEKSCQSTMDTLQNKCTRKQFVSKRKRRITNRHHQTIPG